MTWQRVSERQTKLFDTGVFDDETADKGKKKTKEKRDEDEAVVLMAEIAQYADMFYRDIAVDEKQWWSSRRAAPWRTCSCCWCP